MLPWDASSLLPLQLTMDSPPGLLHGPCRSPSSTAGPRGSTLTTALAPPEVGLWGSYRVSESPVDTAVLTPRNKGLASLAECAPANTVDISERRAFAGAIGGEYHGSLLASR